MVSYNQIRDHSGRFKCSWPRHRVWYSDITVEVIMVEAWGVVIMVEVWGAVFMGGVLMVELWRSRVNTGSCITKYMLIIYTSILFLWQIYINTCTLKQSHQATVLTGRWCTYVRTYVMNWRVTEEESALTIHVYFTHCASARGRALPKNKVRLGIPLRREWDCTLTQSHQAAV